MEADMSLTRSHKRPIVHMKVSLTADGAIARRSGARTRLVCDASRKRVHEELRGKLDAILIGAATARIDDPQLTCRSGVIRNQPHKVIVTRSGEVPATLRCFQEKPPIVCRGDCSMADWLAYLSDRGIESILVEGGGSVFRQIFEAELWDVLTLIWTPHRCECPDVLRVRPPPVQYSRYRVGDDMWWQCEREQ